MKIYEKNVFKNDTNLFEMLVRRKVMCADMEVL